MASVNPATDRLRACPTCRAVSASRLPRAASRQQQDWRRRLRILQADFVQFAGDPAAHANPDLAIWPSASSARFARL
jgi:hypothetical protein